MTRLLSKKELLEIELKDEWLKGQNPTPRRYIKFSHKGKAYTAEICRETTIGYEIVGYFGNGLNLKYIPHKSIIKISDRIENLIYNILGM